MKPSPNMPSKFNIKQTTRNAACKKKTNTGIHFTDLSSNCFYLLLFIVRLDTCTGNIIHYSKVFVSCNNAFCIRTNICGLSALMVVGRFVQYVEKKKRVQNETKIYSC